MKDKNKKRLLLCFCCAMAISAIPFGFASCNKDKKPTSSVEIDYNEDGVYYAQVGGKDCLLTLVDGKHTFMLIIGTEAVTGTYSYNGKDFKMKFDGVKETKTAVYEEGKLTFEYNGVTYEFVAKIDYTVTFDVDGVKTNKTAINGQCIEEPAAPEKEGYNFIGWYLDAEYKTPFLFDSMPIMKNTVLYARFVKKIVGAQEYTVTYIVDGEVYKSVETKSGALYGLEEPVVEGKEFVGWWTSAYQDATKLTAKYEEGQKISENTNLYAVWKSDKINVSVTDTKITWNEKNATARYEIKIYNANNEIINNGGDTTDLEEYAFDFTKQGGEYRIEVTVLGGETTTVYYKSKALDRVSTFSVVGDVFMFSSVPNAERYLLTIVCGNETHNIDLGTTTFYNFSGCEMKKGGIEFTVEAVAEDYVSSVSETYKFEQNLASVTDLAVDAENAQVGWTKVPNATSYVIAISVGGGDPVTATVTTTTYSLKEYSGELTISVYPVAKGYNSPDAQTITYTKASLAAPTNLAIKDKKITWTAVDGATKYLVKISDREFMVTSPELVLTSEHYDTAWDKAKVSVQAMGESAESLSNFSDALTIRISSMSELKYINGAVTWESVISAKEYYVKVNSQEVRKLDATVATYSPMFDKAGENIITVYYADATGNTSDAVSISVNAYKIQFDVDGGSRVAAIYKATGDALTLPTNVTKDGYDFGGWYTAPGGTGTLYTETVFQDESNRMLYAFWKEKSYDLTFNTNGGEELDEVVKVTYKQGFELPIPTHSDSSYVFAGWYNQNESGVIGSVQYTDKDGKSLAGWSSANGETLCAKWLHVLQFTLTANNVYTVSAGRDITRVSTVTIPATQKGVLVAGIQSNAFEGLQNLIEINVPDTIQMIDLGLDGGHGAGSAFVGCSALKKVNVYCVDSTAHDNTHKADQVYFSENGSLVMKNGGRMELAFIPAMATTGEYVVPSNVTYIPIGAFRNTKNITKITIPASVSYIGDMAFDASYVQEIVFEKAADGETEVPLEMGTYIFRKCTKLKNITFPARLSRFDSGWFSGCTALSAVDVEEGGAYSSIEGVVTKQTTLVFVPAAKYSANYTIPEGITTVGEGAFIGNRAITKVTIPYYVTLIDTSAFQDCTYIKAVEFWRDAQSALLDIETKAFHGCTSITELKLPTRIGYVAQYAFGGTSNLTKVVVNGDSEMELENGAFKDEKYGTFAVLDVELGPDVEDVNIAGVFGGLVLRSVKVDSKNDHFESGTAATGDAGVLYTKGKTSIVYYPAGREETEFAIPETVTVIGAQVFQAKPLQKITIGANVVEIQESAFQDCASLTEVIFAPAEEGVQEKALKIGKWAFRGTKVQTIELPDRVTEVATQAFYNCSSLTTIHIGANTTKIGAYNSNNMLTAMDAFVYCHKLTTITVSEDNTAFAVKDGVLYGTTAVTTDGTTTYVLTDLLLCPKYNAGTDGAVVIPNTVETIWTEAFANTSNVKSVSFSGAIEDLTFQSRVFYGSALESVALPAGITEITEGLFDSCRSLTSIFVPNTVTYIGPKAFSLCTSLSTITFEDGDEDLEFDDGSQSSGTYASALYYTAVENLVLPARTTYIGDFAFACNEKLVSVNIPENVTYVGESIFVNCPKLETVTFAETSNLSYIMDGMFQGAKSLKNVTLPSGIRTIGANAFKDCSALTNINIPNSVTSIGEGAFENARALQYVAIDKVNSNLATIGDRAFYNCSALNRTVAEATETPVFALPKTVKTVGEFAFNGCTALKVVTFENGSALTMIESKAFAFSGLTAFTFPNTANDADGNFVETKYGNMIFGGCANLKTITLSNAIKSMEGLMSGCYSLEDINIDDSNEYFSVFKSADAVFVMDKNQTEYKYILGTMKGKLEIKEGIQAIDAGSFAGITGITELVIPATVKTIGKEAFKGCRGLTKVTFAAGSQITAINEGAFLNCPSLATVNLENATSLTTVAKNAFKGCTALTAITLGDSITTIGESAFEATGLTVINIPEKVTTISKRAFADCINLANIQLHPYVTKINEAAFSATAIDGAMVANILTSVNTSATYGTGVFGNCVNLTEVTIPAAMTKIPASMFANCTALKTINFHAGVVGIGASAFKNCSALATLAIPTSISNNDIGASAFEGCTSLTTITLPSNITSLGNKVFANCTSLTTVNFPDEFTGFTCTSQTNATFYGCTALGEVELGSDFTTLGTGFANSGIRKISLFANRMTILSNYAFYKCTNLHTVEFDELNNSTIGEIGTYVFQDCAALVNFTLPATVTKLGNYAFRNCTSLTALDTKNIINVGQYAVAGTGITSLDFEKATTVGNYFTQNCASLTSLKLNGTLKSLPTGFLQGCESLKEFTIPSTVTKINGTEILKGCGIERLVLPSAIKASTGSMFKNSTGLKYIEFTYTGSDTLGYNLFLDSKNLETVVFANGHNITKFYSSFTGCSSLKNITIPETVTSIERNEFEECASLENIVIPDKVKLPSDGSVDTKGIHGVFEGCTSLKTVKLPNTWSAIPAYFFYNCKSLETVNIPTSATNIKTYSFFNTSSLKQITIPEKVTTFGSMAFMNSGVKSFALSKSVTSVSSGAFGGDYLEFITVDPANTRFVADENGALYNASKSTLYAFPVANYIDENGVLTIPEGAQNVGWNGGAMWSDRIKSIILPDSITYIASNMFSDMPNLEYVYIPDGVEDIYSKAFYNCPKLKTVRVPASLIEINDSAFENCVSLETLENIESVTGLWYIGQKAFQNCVSLKTMVFPEALEEIGTRAFYGCVSLAVDVDLGSAVNMYELGNEAFNNSGITSMVLPAFIEIIGDEDDRSNVPYYTSDDGYMTNMPNLRSLTLTAVQVVGANAFKNNAKLEELNYSDDLYAIGAYAFYNCGLKTLTLRATVTQLDAYAFANNAQLETLTFEEGVKDVKTYVWSATSYDINNPYLEGQEGFYIFANCTSLKTINFPDTMEIIEMYTFAGCTAIENLYLPAAVIVGSNAFNGLANTIYVATSEVGVEELWTATWNGGFTGNVVYSAQRPTQNTEGENGPTTDGE